MFFEREDLSFNILDVLQLDQGNVRLFNKERNFSALSFRYAADTVLVTEKGEYHLSDNSVLYVPARLEYTRISKQDRLIVIHLETSNYVAKDIECFAAKSPQRLAKLFEKLLHCWNQKETGYKFSCRAALYEILAECYRQNYKPSTPPSRIQASIDYMHQHYKKSDLTIKEIAEQSFVSEVFFRKLFKEMYGTSPQKYIIRLRIRYAAGLISTGYYSLGEIAGMSGYNDYKYFSIEFKKAIGVSPSEYLYNFRA